jgi:hypothetical protein
LLHANDAGGSGDVTVMTVRNLILKLGKYFEMAAAMSKTPRTFTARNCLAEISCLGEVIETLKANLRRLIQGESIVGGKSTQMKPFQQRRSCSKLLPNLGISFLASVTTVVVAWHSGQVALESGDGQW